jgi:transglutaminase-like putative cysteine protease
MNRRRENPDFRTTLPLTARLADRAAGWLQAWRSWLGVVAVFAVLLIPVLTLLRAHWTNTQPPLVLVLALAVGLVWLLYARRFQGLFIHLIAVAVGAALTWWFGFGLNIDAGFRIFAAFLVAAVWLAGYLSAWFVLRLRNAWFGVVTGAATLIINLNNLPDSNAVWFVLYFVAAALFIFEVRLTRNTTATLVSDARPRRGWYFLGTMLLVVIVTATSLSLVLPQPKAPGFQTMVATRVMWKLNMENSPLNIFKVVPSRVEADTVSNQGDLRFGSLWHSQDNIDFIVLSPVPSYWRVRVYDTYTDDGWTNSPMTAYLLDQGTVWTEGLPPNAADHLVTYQVTTQIRTDLVLTAGSFVTADTPYLLHIAGNDNLATTTPRVLAPGEQYTVTSAYETPSMAQLAAVPSGYPAAIGDTYLALPDKFPKNIRDLAKRLTADAKTPYEKVTAIDNYLSTYTYSTGVDAPPPGTDGVEYFLFDSKTGFCTYFASSMAVMLRAVGVPTRLVIGYLPGDAGSQAGQYILRDKYYHAWPQAYFQGYGWVDLEATPSNSEGSGGSQVVLPEPWVSSPDAQPPVSHSDSPFPIEQFLPGNLPPIDQSQYAPATPRNWKFPFADQLGIAILVLIFGGMLLLVLMVPVTAMRAAFNRWLWHVDRQMVAVETFQKMGRLAALARLGPNSAQTPFEYAAALTTAMPEHSEAVATITGAYVNSRFGRAGPPGLFDEAEILKARYRVYAALLDRVGFIRRLFRRY